MIDFGFVTLLCLIPAVLITAYFHGGKEQKEWTKFEKIGIPINVITVILLLFILKPGNMRNKRK